MSTLQKHGRDYIHLYKNEQKGFCPGGILSYTRQISNSYSVLTTTKKKKNCRKLRADSNLISSCLGVLRIKAILLFSKYPKKSHLDTFFFFFLWFWVLGFTAPSRLFHCFTVKSKYCSANNSKEAFRVQNGMKRSLSCFLWFWFYGPFRIISLF